MVETFERTRIALPSGELEGNVSRFLRDVGLEFAMTPKGYLLPVENMPLDFVIVRASSVPRFVYAPSSVSRIVAGVTGSDIVWEAGFGKDAGEQLPIEDFYPRATQPSLFIGVTSGFQKKIRDAYDRGAAEGDLGGKMLVTKFPRISGDYLAEKNMMSVTYEAWEGNRYQRNDPQEVVIWADAGKTEAAQYALYDCEGIIDVVDSGQTIAANGIEELERFYTVTTRMIETAEKMNVQDRVVLDDLRNKIYVALQARRIV